MTCVARIWRDEADGAVQVFTIVPTSEGLDPGLSIGLGGKALGRPFRTVLACSEQRLGERPRQRARTDGARCLDRC